MRSLFGKAKQPQRFLVDGVSIPALAGWTETERAPDRIVVKSADGRQGVTLSTMRFTADPTAEEFGVLCQHRLDAERADAEQTGSPREILEGGEPRAVADGFVMVYTGMVRDTANVFSGFLSLQRHQLATVYLESFDQTAEQHLQVFQTLAAGLARV